MHGRNRYLGRVVTLLCAAGVGLFWAAFDDFRSPTSLSSDRLLTDVSIACVLLFLAFWFGLQLDRLRFVAHHDLDTNVYNRRYIMSLMAKLRGSCAIFVIDLNELKQLNDQFGHAVGDEAIRCLADSLVACAQVEDVIGRFGGDEFIIVTRLADRQALEELVRWIKTDMSMRVIGPAASPRLSVAIGYAMVPKDAPDILMAMHLADKRMYQDKSTSKLAYL